MMLSQNQRHFLYPDEMRIPQDVDLARQECREMLTVLERHMQENEYVVVDRLSVADFSAAYVMTVLHDMAVQAKAGFSRDMLVVITEHALSTWPGSGSQTAD
ncbi:glutathione binding-like protein [Billgrantia lactosivorans]|uniref:glutathione binding-like protein n=1 Tax=Billgrantia lactosivorans TaxID=2185141 RepID=UPI001FEB95F7|nr:glutathione binding-like protein [Halomonas lactosivorans]